MKIRTVTVELLRAGPRHNQLLSPLTQYLAVCGDAPAGRVTLPYEHRDMELRLQDLNYRVATDDDRSRRERILERTGDEIADILSQIPGLAGALNSETERADTLTQLRIVLSASELAMLPFELTKSPASTGPSGRWLALQARMPVCITRHIRSVSAEGMRWPTDPRILFVAGPETPFDQHHQALRDALSPWRDPGGGVGDRLHVLERATLAQIAAAVTGAARAGAPFSHVHILAHGDRLDETDVYSPVGVALHDEVVAGARLTTALSAVTGTGVVRPAVVTLATCESGTIADVRTPDASVAHDLHDSGIPLVVASQFPLTVDGSVPLIARFYQGQLRGEHPLVSLYDARMLLHGCMSHHAHDWAAVVVYEAFPSDLSGQLEDLRYGQMRRAQDGALRRAEALVKPAADPSGAATDAAGPADAAKTAELFADADAAGTQLPDSGPYALECTGLRAAGHKRLAEAAFRIAIMPGTSEARRDQLFAECLRRLDDARSAYWHASRSFLGPADLTRRKASLHWLLGQVLSLDVILGRPFNTEAWAAASLAARIETRDGDEGTRAWAQAGLLELGLLGLENERATVEQRRAHLESALRDAALLVEMLGRNADQVLATIRQLERYIKLWGNPQLADALERLGFPNRERWRDDYGLVRAAEKIVKMLRGSAPVGDATTKRRGGDAAPEPKASTVARERETVARERVPVAQGAPAAAAPTPVPPPSLSGASRSSTVFDIELLPAENGDCLWIEYGDPQRPHRIVIDCGAKSTAGLLASRLKSTPLELFVLTHIDADHISGVVPLFENPALQIAVGDVWFNGWRQINRFLGVKQGEQFSDLLEQRNLPWNRAMTQAGDRLPAPVVVAAGQPLPAYELAGGMRLTVLSPGKAQLERMARDWKKALVELNPQKVAMLGRKPAPQPVKDLAAFALEPLASAPAKPDPSVANGSSIALLAEFGGRSVLLTGDAHADVLIQSIGQLMRERGKDGQKLKLDAIKLSHHGSGNATTIPLLQTLDCGRYFVSTNGNIFNHPDREAIARVILHGGKAPTLCFNYQSAMNALWGEPILRERYGYATEYPDAAGAGLRVRL